MPAGLPATPWIRSYETPDLYLKGYSQGSEIAQAQARIAAAQQEAQARLAAAQQEAERDAQMKMQMHQQNSLVEQQKIAIENQYRQTQIGLAKQKAEEEAMMDQWKIKQAANVAAKRMEASSRIKAGESWTDVYRDLGPQMGIPMGAMSKLFEAPKTLSGPMQTFPVMGPEGKPIEGAYAYEGASGPAIYHPTPPKQDLWYEKHDVTAAEARINTLEKLIAEFRYMPDIEEKKKEVIENKKQVNAAYKAAGKRPRYPDVEEIDTSEFGEPEIIGGFKVWKSK